jgi:Deacetylase PdaC
MPRTAILSAMILLVTGCDGAAPDPSQATPTQHAAASANPPAPPAPPAKAPAGRAVKEENDLFEFEYSYPAKAAAIPALKALLDKRLDASRSELVSKAKSDQAEAAKDGYPYRKHSAGATWQVVADLPRWLSLSAELYEYSGGAHGMTFFDALLWDREHNMARAASDLFISKAALSLAIREPFCAALDKEREKRRGAPVNRKSGDGFDECIDPAEHAVILGSSNGRTFDRIGVLVEPYAAGSYAEGTFDITLPVTERILGSVKPAYRSAFSVR